MLLTPFFDSFSAVNPKLVAISGSLTVESCNSILPLSSYSLLASLFNIVCYINDTDHPVVIYCHLPPMTSSSSMTHPVVDSFIVTVTTPTLAFFLLSVIAFLFIVVYHTRHCQPILQSIIDYYHHDALFIVAHRTTTLPTLHSHTTIYRLPAEWMMNNVNIDLHGHFFTVNVG